MSRENNSGRADVTTDTQEEITQQSQNNRVSENKLGYAELTQPATVAPALNELENLPASWLITSLGQIIDYGKVKKAEPNEIHNETWVLELEDIEKDSSKIIQRLTFLDRQSKSTKNRFETGDVLYGKLRPYLNKVVVADSDGVCTTEILPLSGNAFLHNSYLFYWLKHPRFLAYVTQVGYGVNMPRLGTKDGIAAPFILAPLAEQYQMAAKLDELLAQVDSIKTRLDAIPKILKRFRQSLLAAAVSGKLTKDWRSLNPEKTTAELLNGFNRLKKPARYGSRTSSFIKGVCATAVGKPEDKIIPEWDWIPIIDVARMESGHTPSRSKPEYWGGDINWIGIKDARKNHAGTIFITSQTTNNLGLENSASRLLPTNTICVSRTASVGYVVKMGKPMATSQDFVNWVPSEVLNSDWLKWLFVAENESLFRFGKGSTHTTIYFPEWLSLHIALPHIDEQTEIVRRVEQLFTYADQIEQRVKDAQSRVNQLTQSILAKAFRGELTADWRAQNPDLISGENSAEALLARIEAERLKEKPKYRRMGRASRNPS